MVENFNYNCYSSFKTVSAGQTSNIDICFKPATLLKLNLQSTHQLRPTTPHVPPQARSTLRQRPISPKPARVTPDKLDFPRETIPFTLATINRIRPTTTTMNAYGLISGVGSTLPAVFCPSSSPSQPSGRAPARLLRGVMVGR